MKSKVIIIILATLVLSISCAKEEPQPQQKPDQLEKFTEYEWDWK